MTWRLRITDVREHQCALRWTLEAVREDERVVVTADSRYDGQVTDLQTGDGYVHTTGDDELDDRVTAHIGAVRDLSTIVARLAVIDRARQHRTRAAPRRRAGA
jgi:hypothetical protein